MGLFTRTRPPEDDACRRYLELAPPGPRTGALAASCVLRTMPHPVAASYGALLTPADLDAGIEIVREVLRQDRDLSAWIARKAMVQMNFALDGGVNQEDMSARGLGPGLPLGLQAVGLTLDGDRIVVWEESSASEQVDPASAIATASSALAVLHAAVAPDATPAERELYQDLYTGESGRDVESLGYEIAAWASIAVARTANAGLLPQSFDPAFRDVPAMPAAGWYPNPGKTGPIVQGEAAFQRYWDGAAWTDRARVRQGRDWTTVSLSLHAPPTD